MAETIASFVIELGFSDKAAKSVEKLEKAIQGLDTKIKNNANKRMSLEDKVLAKQKTNMKKTEQIANQKLVTDKKGILKLIAMQREAAAKNMTQEQIIKEFKKNADLDAKQRAMEAIARVRKRQKLEKDLAKQRTMADNRKKEAAKFLLNSSIRQRVEEGKLNAEKVRAELLSVKNLKSQKFLQQQILSDQRSAVRAEKEQLRVARQRLSVRLKERASSSAVQLAGGAFSAFALAGVGQGVVRTGQEFQALNNAILAASLSSEDAGNNFEFVRRTAERLGLDLVQAGKGFSQFLAAGQGKLAQADLENVFLGVSEASTAMGLSADDTAGSIRAIVQIMSKGKVQAEELRGQLGERLPVAFRLMADSMGVTTQELDKLLEQGKVYAKDVLPAFGQALRDFSRQNDALDNSLESNRIALNRLKLSFQLAGDEISKAGFSDGLTDLFNQLAISVKDLIPLGRVFGRIFGAVAKTLTGLLKVVTPPLEFIGIVFDNITEKVGMFNALIGGGLLGVLVKLTSKFGVVGAALSGALGAKALGIVTTFSNTLKVLLSRALALAAPFVAVAVILDEINNLLKEPIDRKEGLFSSPTSGGLTSQGSSLSAAGIFGNNAFTRFLDKPILGINPIPPSSSGLTNVAGVKPMMVTPVNNFNVNVMAEIDGKPLRSMAQEVAVEEMSNFTFTD